MVKEIKTDNAPKAIGPYSQAVIVGDFIYLSGQIAINPMTIKLVEGGIKPQTAQVIDNLKAILVSKGFALNNIVKTEVYLADMNEVYLAKFIGGVKPARQAVQVARLPIDAKVEISAIAYTKNANE